MEKHPGGKDPVSEHMNMKQCAERGQRTERHQGKLFLFFSLAPFLIVLLLTSCSSRQEPGKPVEEAKEGAPASTAVTTASVTSSPATSPQEVETTQPPKLEASEEQSSASQARSASCENLPRVDTHPSPYLRSLTSSSVEWHVWSAELLDCAQKTRKPILVSVGASWSSLARQLDQSVFSAPELAAFINSNFIPVKIDSDAQPDLESRLSVFYSIKMQAAPPRSFIAVVLPEGLPFDVMDETSASLSPTSVLDWLRQSLDIFNNSYSTVQSQARNAAELIDNLISLLKETSASSELDVTTAKSFVARVVSNASAETIKNQKDPATVARLALLLLHDYSENGTSSSFELAQRLLSDLYKSPLRDCVFGGYFREIGPEGFPTEGKLLSVQAEVLSAYCQCYGATGKKLYREAAEEILRFLSETLEQEEGGFFSSQECDLDPTAPSSYFSWSAKEVLEILGDTKEAKVFLNYYGLQGLPPEQKKHLVPVRSLQAVASSLSLDYDTAQKALDAARAKLRQTRYEQDSFPRVNKAFITSWNALAVSAYADAFRYLSDNRARDFALKTARVLIDSSTTATVGVPHYSYKKQNLSQVFAEDQITVANALLDCAEISKKMNLVAVARDLMEHTARTYSLANTSILLDLPEQMRESSHIPYPLFCGIRDTLLPSPNALAALVWGRLYQITGEDAYRRHALDVLSRVTAHSDWWDLGMATFARGLLMCTQTPCKVVIVGIPENVDSESLWESALRTFRLGKFVEILSPEEANQTDYLPAKDGRATAYVCVPVACAPPTRDVNKLRTIIRDFGKERK